MGEKTNSDRDPFEAQDTASSAKGTPLEEARQNVVRMTAVGHGGWLMHRSPLHKHLMPADWKSGSDLWLIDFVAPMGGQDEMIRELKDKVPAGKSFTPLQPVSDGRVGGREW